MAHMRSHPPRSSRSPSPLACLLLLAVALLPATRAPAALEAGTAAVDITPEKWPVALRGSFSPRKAKSAHDPLHARSVALQNGKGRFVITIVDILYIDQDTVDRMKEAAAEATGWGADEMLIAGTHTHSAPSASGSGDDPAEAAFRERAFHGVVSSIQRAVESLRPAEIGFGSDEVPEEVFNRRWFLKEGKMPPNPFGGIDEVKMNPPRDPDVLDEPAGPTDPEVAVVSLRRQGGKPLGLLANYALHYVGRVPGRQVSADYFGEFARIVPYRVAGRSAPDDFVAMLSNGASGDINNIDFHGDRPPRAPFEQIRVVATKVADAVWRATREMDYYRDPEVAMVERRITLHRRKPGEKAVAEAKRVIDLPREELDELPRLAPHYAMRTLRLAERPDTVDVVIQAARVGDQAIVSLPFEVLVEIGLELKEKSPFPRTMVIELANGAFGYLPTPRQHELGGYETWLGTNKVQKDASVILTGHLLEMLGELHGEG